MAELRVGDLSKIEQRFKIGNQTLSVVGVDDIGEQGFDVRFANTTSGKKTLAHDPLAHLSARDDLGGKYTIEGYGYEYGEDRYGASIPGSLVLRFAEPLNKDASSLVISVSSLGEFVYGPDVRLPRR